MAILKKPRMQLSLVLSTVQLEDVSTVQVSLLDDVLFNDDWWLWLLEPLQTNIAS